MNPSAILSLISDLYSQVAALTEERDRLLAELQRTEGQKHEQ